MRFLCNVRTWLLFQIFEKLAVKVRREINFAAHRGVRRSQSDCRDWQYSEKN